jgi:hypothetical protein
MMGGPPQGGPFGPPGRAGGVGGSLGQPSAGWRSRCRVKGRRASAFHCICNVHRPPSQPVNKMFGTKPYNHIWYLILYLLLYTFASTHPSTTKCH